jgi:hypothetical protein
MYRQTLVDAKTVSITHLLAISPPGTLDPTPMLYDSTMYVPRCALLWRTCLYVPTSLVLRAFVEPAFVTQWHCCMRPPASHCRHVSNGPFPFSLDRYGMGGLLTVALLCNAAIRPVDPKHYIVDAVPVDAASTSASTSTAATNTNNKSA